MRWATSVLGLAVAAVALAGCTSGPAATGGAGDPKAGFTEATGGVEGRILNDEFQPVVGAFLQVLGTNKTMNSTTTGAFAFGELEPLDYLLIVRHPDYVERKVPFSVPLGNVTKLDVLLEIVPPPVAWVDDAETFVGKIPAAACVMGTGAVCQSSTGSVLIPTEYRMANVDTFRILDDHWSTILVEVEWTGGTQWGDDLRVLLKVPRASPSFCATNFEIKRETGSSPLALRLERTEHDAARADDAQLCPLKAKTLVQVEVHPAIADDPFSLYVDQTFTVYETVAYNGALADGYSRVA